MANRQISVKVYHLENGATKEIRKFPVEEDVASNYENLIGRIKFFFTSLADKDILLYWKDGEGDNISISSNCELSELLKAQESVDHLKLYTKVKDNKSVNNPHLGIVCDGCESSINGVRFKCTVCPDFDLCSSCEVKIDHPVDHDLLCIKTPKQRFGRSRGCGPWMRRGKCPVSFFPYQMFRKCPSSKESDGEQNEAKKLSHIIKELATSFGLDPDVALSQAQAFLDNLQCSASSDGKVHGMDPGYLKEILEALFKSSCGNKEEEEKPESHGDKEMPNTSDDIDMETTPVDEKVGEKSQDAKLENDFSDITTSFMNQMGLGPQLGEEQLKDLGQVIGSVMQNIGEHFSSMSPRSGESKEFAEKSESTPQDGFVIVDETKNTQKMTEEELYEKRLNECLLQLEAMGFDNDGDWLKQLLVAKDLNISRVLDALHPPK
jgi:sequestosome 1